MARPGHIEKQRITEWIIFLVVTVLLAVACNKKSISSTPSTDGDKRVFLQAVYPDLSFERNLREKGYDKFYFYLVEEEGKKYLELANSPILWRTGRHQMPLLSTRLFRFELAVEKQITVQNRFLLMYENVPRGTVLIARERAVVETLCEGPKHFCSLLSADKSRLFNKASFTFDPEGPTEIRFQRACNVAVFEKDLCSLLQLAEKRLQETRGQLVLLQNALQSASSVVESYQRDLFDRWKAETTTHQKSLQDDKRAIIDWVTSNHSSINREKIEREIVWMNADTESTLRFIKNTLNHLKKL